MTEVSTSAAVSPRAPAGRVMAEHLNQTCFCRSLDPARLREQLSRGGAQAQELDPLVHTHPNLFSSTVVFLSASAARQIEATVAAVEQVVQFAPYQAQALRRAPAIAQVDWGPRGVCMGFDFHIDDTGPKLIEVNTNAGGLMLNLALARAQSACCDELDWALADRTPILDQTEHDIFEMFVAEWRWQRGAGLPSHLAIVDEDPDAQYLGPEFGLFRHFFEQRGVPSSVVDVRDLRAAGGRLMAGTAAVDMVYNRLTDFYLAAPPSAALRTAYADGAVVLTPHPRAHALYADKRNLIVLSDDAQLASWGVDAHTRAVLSASVPRTEAVTAASADALWARRRSLFFKPATGYGARAAYRGDKLTRRVWSEIVQGDYVAQAIVAPGERYVEVDGVRADLKFDVRAYAYAGRVQLLAARMYAGQTTNFRTAGGGFAPVVTLPDGVCGGSNSTARPAMGK